MKIRNLIITLLLGAVFFTVFSDSISAQTDEIFSSLNSLYTVSETTTYVTHNLTFENQAPTVFISQFGFQIPHTDLENIKVEVDGTPIVANIVTTENQTSIGITFPDKLVGQGKKKDITITYQDDEIASFTQKSGQVIIPQPNQIESFDEYTLRVNSPEDAGLPLITSQIPDSTTSKSSGAEVTYKQLNPGTLSLYYGQEQPFDFEFTYHLTNENNSASILQIPLPPDTEYQTIRFDTIEPQPESIAVDVDGNWIASYQLASQSNQVVHVQGQALLTRQKREDYLTVLPSKQYVKSDNFWQSDNTQIKTWIKSADSIQSLWELLEPLEPYIQKKQVRSKPEDALDQSLVTAENIVDLFISGARALDVPSRRAIGPRTDDQKHPAGLESNNLHVWAEYFDADQNTWLPVDPYWQLSLGDRSFVNQPLLANMVLAYNGVSSTAPFPQNLDTDLVFTPSDHFNYAPHNFTTEIRQRFPFQLPIPGSYNLTLTNRTGQALYTIPISISEPDGTVLFEDTVSFVLPFQSTNVPLHLFTNDWFTSDDVTLQLALDDTYQNITITRGPKILKFIFSPFGVIVGASVIIGTLAAGSVLVFRR